MWTDAPLLRGLRTIIERHEQPLPVQRAQLLLLCRDALHQLLDLLTTAMTTSEAGA